MSLPTLLPDGREVVAEWVGGAFGQWVLRLPGSGEASVRGRLLGALLVGIAGGRSPELEAVLEDLEPHRDLVDGRRFQCSCCGNFTLEKPPVYSFETCLVCRWEEDAVQFEDPDFPGGPNRPSLREARANYLQLGVSDAARSGRPPTPDERP